MNYEQRQETGIILAKIVVLTLLFKILQYMATIDVCWLDFFPSVKLQNRYVD